MPLNTPQEVLISKYLKAAAPLDAKIQKDTLVERDAIPAGDRYPMMRVDVLENEGAYILDKTDLTNTGWKIIAAGDVISVNGAQGVVVLKALNIDIDPITGITATQTQAALAELKIITEGLSTGSIYFGAFDPATPPINPPTDGDDTNYNQGDFYRVSVGGIWNFPLGDQTVDGNEVTLQLNDTIRYNQSSTWDVFTDNINLPAGTVEGAVQLRNAAGDDFEAFTTLKFLGQKLIIGDPSTSHTEIDGIGNGLRFYSIALPSSNPFMKIGPNGDAIETGFINLLKASDSTYGIQLIPENDSLYRNYIHTGTVLLIGAKSGGNEKALVDIQSTTKGFLIPRMTTAQRTAMSLVAGDIGLKVYDTDLVGEYSWNGTVWVSLSGSSGWALTGTSTLTGDVVISGAASGHGVELGSSANPIILEIYNKDEQILLTNIVPGTTGVNTVAHIHANSSGTVTDNFGVGLDLLADNDSGAAKIVMAIAGIMTDVTATTEDSQIRLSVLAAGTQTHIVYFDADVASIFAATSISLDSPLINMGDEAAAGAAQIVVKSSDTNANLKLVPKGTGTVNITSLPTSAAGLSAGDLWNNSGVVNVA